MVGNSPELNTSHEESVDHTVKKKKMTKWENYLYPIFTKGSNKHYKKLQYKELHKHCRKRPKS